MRAKKRKKRWTWILFYQGPARKPEATPDVLMKNLTRWISKTENAKEKPEVTAGSSRHSQTAEAKMGVGVIRT